MPPTPETRSRPAAAIALGVAILAAFAIVAYRDVVFAGRTMTTAALVPGSAGMDGVWGHPGGRKGRPRVLDPGASGWQYEPWTYAMHDMLERGEFPLWNPHAAFGAPLAANGLSGAMTPIRWPLLAAPSPERFDAYLLARLVLGATLALLLFRRLGLALAASVAGAATFGYCGYFVLHANMTHLDVEIFLPLLLLGTDAACGARSGSRGVALLAIATALAALGGNPESLAIALLAAGAFALVRARLRPSALLRAGAGITLGLALAAPLLIPEIEFVVNAAHVHDSSVGLVAQARKTVLMALVPDFFGGVHDLWTNGNPQWRWVALGAAPWALAVAGLAAVTKRPGLVLFFAGLVAVSMAKVFGFEAAQWLGRLPVLDVILFTKHLQPAIALGVGALAAIAVDRVARGESGRLAAVLGTLAIAGAIALGALRFREEAEAAGEARAMWGAVGEQAACLVALVVAASALRGSRAAGALAAAVLVGMFLGVPGHRPERSDPRAEPPYLAALRADSGGPFRVAGYDGVLHANWSSVFGIDDVRSLDALNVKTSLAWARERVEPLVLDRLTGLESYSADFLSSAMDAANVRYLLGSAPIEDPATRVLARRAGATLEAAGPRPALRVDPGAPVEVALPVSPRGARFDARVTAGEGARARVEIDGAPAGDAANGERLRAFPALAAGASGVVRMRLVAEGGTVHLSEVDPAIFGERWESVPVEGPFRLYRNREALPRAYVVGRAVSAATDVEARARAASPAFDARAEVMLETTLDEGAAARASFAEAPIVARRSDALTVSVEGLGPGWLVLLDAFYPGWVARVDGVEVPIVRANGAFRAVAIGESAKRVEFAYEPLSFRGGCAIAVLAAVVILLCLARRPEPMP